MKGALHLQTELFRRHVQVHHVESVNQDFFFDIREERLSYLTDDVLGLALRHIGLLHPSYFNEGEFLHVVLDLG